MIPVYKYICDEYVYFQGNYEKTHQGINLKPRTKTETTLTTVPSGLYSVLLPTLAGQFGVSAAAAAYSADRRTLLRYAPHMSRHRLADWPNYEWLHPGRGPPHETGEELYYTSLASLSSHSIATHWSGVEGKKDLTWGLILL